MSSEKLSDAQISLLAILVFAALIYCRALYLFNDVAHLLISSLFFLAIFDIFWRNRHQKCISMNYASAISGGVLIALSSIFILKYPSYYTIRSFPFLFGIGFVAMAAGFRAMRQYSKEIILLFFIGIPSIIGTKLPDLSPITAKVSSLFLTVCGFPSSASGPDISLFDTTVRVWRGCSGIEAITYLLGLSVICLVLFPVSRHKAYSVPAIAIGIGYIINAIRVSVLCVLHVSGMSRAFEYWHVEEGALIVGAISVLIFSIVYWLMLRDDFKRPSFKN
jgi:cyanoexosortase A